MLEVLRFKGKGGAEGSLLRPQEPEGCGAKPVPRGWHIHSL